MPHLSAALRRIFASLVLSASLPCLAQTVSMGISISNGGNLAVSSVETVLGTTYPANVSGHIVTATFGWSHSPCPASVKIKVFRPSSPGTFPAPVSFAFVGERGPFDVTAPVKGSGLIGLAPFASQTVMLNPAIDVQVSDVIAITNLTTCGGPVHANWSLGAPPPAGGSFIVPGDVSSTIATSQAAEDSYIFLTASGTGPALGLLSNRFVITLDASDPRTGATAIGVPIPLGPAAGYFSLPAFTGDTTFPEVMVKMVDATASPALGGDFWFFHAPLTDVHYTLTVIDQITGVVKTYSNSAGNPGQLCGAVDASAFTP